MRQSAILIDIDSAVWYGRMEAEELRYEKEVLEWKLQEAAGSRYAPQPVTPSIWPGPRPGIGPQPAFNGTIERAVQAKHVSIYPTMHEVCLRPLSIVCFAFFISYYCKMSSTEMVCNLGRCIVMPMLAMDRTTISSIYPLFRPTYDHQNENSYERKHCQCNVMTIIIVIIMIWWCDSCMFIILICHFLLCALAGCGAVYCNQSCLWVCVCWSITMITRNCMHRSSPNWVCR